MFLFRPFSKEGQLKSGIFVSWLQFLCLLSAFEMKLVIKIKKIQFSEKEAEWPTKNRCYLHSKAGDR